jgi:hypothetical protein
MRQRYETEGDRQAEEVALRGYLAGSKNVTYSKLGPSYPADFAISDPTGTVVEFVEVKCRSCLSTTYPTLQISLRKISDLAGLYQISGVPATLLISYHDQVKALDVSRPSWDRAKITIGGRTDRGDPSDIEPMLNIEIAGMKTVYERKDFII